MTLIEYTLLRQLVIVFISMALLKEDPLASLPTQLRLPMLARAFCGLVTVLLLQQSLELIPFSLLIILY